jgi:putative endonuclease
MKVDPKHNYSIYIVTNPGKSTLYTGVTNNLPQRLIEHWTNRGQPKTFAGKYFCYLLIYFEDFQYIHDAIAREKEIKGWSRKKKAELIKTMNPLWLSLNASICGGWPPAEIPTRF